jgi:hypothetical protein
MTRAGRITLTLCYFGPLAIVSAFSLAVYAVGKLAQ